MLLKTDIVVLKRKDLDAETVLKIARLKQQWWPYPLESQTAYLKNLPEADQHIVGIVDDNIVSYLRLARRVARAQGKSFQVAGVSTVCADKAHQKKGLGREIVLAATDLVDQKRFDFALLQTSKAFVDFYLKCGFSETPLRFFSFNEKKERVATFREPHVMMYPNKGFNFSEMEIEGGGF